MSKVICSLLLACFFVLQSCATVGDTRNLTPGMTVQEVKATLGEPSQVQFSNQKVVYKYSLHEMFTGWVPYYLVFNKETLRLEEWAANLDEYNNNQALGLQAVQSFQQQNRANASVPAQQAAKQIDFGCMNKCSASGNTYGLCTQKCSY